jgi:hypothetical protein
MSSQAALLMLVGVLLANHAAITAAASNRTVETAKSSYQASDTLWSYISEHPEDPAAHIIAILTSKRLIVERFQHVCEGKQQETDNRARQTVKGIPSACWLLQGSCHRLFQASLPGTHPLFHPTPPAGRRALSGDCYRGQSLDALCSSQIYKGIVPRFSTC